MTEVEILLSKFTSCQEKIDAIERIIEIYNLPLTQEEIAIIFNKARLNESIYERHEFLFNTLLNNNKYMFVAIVKNGINGKIFSIWAHSVLVKRGTNYSIGINYASIAVVVYCELLNHCDFNIDDLDIEEKHMILIQQYRLEKYGGNKTKYVKK